MLVINGGLHEGGGGLVRSALTFSSLLNKPLRLYNVRAQRPGSQGLRPGHNAAIDAVRLVTGALVQGNHAWSSDLQFTPHAANPANFSNRRPQWPIDTPVEGSASIFLISILQYLLFSQLASSTSNFKPLFDGETEFQLTVRAGMLCLDAPSIFYLRQVFLPTMNLIGITAKHLRFTSEYEEGWWNDGIFMPGKMVAVVKPLAKPLDGFVLKPRGKIRRIQVTAHVPKHVRARFQDILDAEIADAISAESYDVEIVKDIFGSIPEDQYHLLMTATAVSPEAYLGYELIYPHDTRFPAEIRGDEEKTAIHLIRACIRGLWKELKHGNAVDEHMEDILTMYQSVASGFSSVIAREEEVAVPELSMDYAALGPRGSNFDVDTASIHRQTSWWLSELIAGVSFEERTIEGVKRGGCEGMALGMQATVSNEAA